MEGSLPRPARSRPLEQPTAPPARRRDDARRLPLVLSLLAVLAITFVLTENRRIERRSHFEEKTRRGTDDLRERRIPPVIWQTWRSRPDPATPLGRQVRLLKARNPSHQYHFVDDKAQATFMRTNMTGAVADAYFSIDPENGAARADLWRYMVVLKEGGLYADSDVLVTEPFAEWDALDPAMGCEVVIGLENDFHLCQWAIFSLRPHHPLLDNVVSFVLRRIMEGSRKSLKWTELLRLDEPVHFVHEYTGPKAVSYTHLTLPTKA